MQESLSNSKWDTFYNLEDPEEAWNVIRTKIEELLNVSCPIKRIKIKKLKDPWVTNELLELISDKEEALKTARRTDNEDDWHIARYLRNLIKGLARATKGIT